jgi:hypothetical protein
MFREIRTVILLQSGYLDFVAAYGLLAAGTIVEVSFVVCVERRAKTAQD